MTLLSLFPSKSIFSWEHFLCALTVCKDMLLRISYSAVFINEYFKGSFSFYRCLPAGWGVLLISGLTTAFSERMFLNRNRFKQTLPIHMVIGIMCLGFSLLEIYRGEKQFLMSIVKSLKGHDKHT
uniref:Protein RFT1 homolog n=1 Tax=Aegilops tauschii subsp. strangulata TaxID=200361 RepID=A0A453PUQ5_AEGTS